MLKRTARTLAATAVMIVPAAVLTTLGATGASAASIRPHVTAVNRFVNVHLGTCISENGDTSEVLLSGCNTNHSEFWHPGASGPNSSQQIVNLHSGLCLSVAGTASTVSASPCNSNHAEFWQLIASGSDIFIRNLHSGLCLEGLGSSVIQEPCTSNHAFLWRFA
jgi:hypothetical protein